ncbi:hypothetical protein M0802_005642 [Mischocyttarus mexicanus]|nr:hypothetical protein M0802_005642 [Mischocyttarus mexicanus]
MVKAPTMGPTGGPQGIRKIHPSPEIAMNPRNLQAATTNLTPTVLRSEANTLGSTTHAFHPQVDVSTQVDLHSGGGSFHGDWDRRATPLYSREDIKEQYCITSRQLDAVEKSTGGFFGCLSTRGPSPCSSTRSSILSACVRSVPSDENLCDAPYPRYPLQIMYQQPYTNFTRGHSRYDVEDDIEVFRRRPRTFCTVSDPKRSRSPPRSHNPERLIDSQPMMQTTTVSSNLPLVHSYAPLIRDKFPKRGVMKTQATQTEISADFRSRVPPVTLSPRTIHRVKMVSQGAQTNGLFNGRKLTKSYSEAGQLGTPLGGIQTSSGSKEEMEHEPLHRTQSEEPPRSPFIVDTPPSQFPSYDINEDESLPNGDIDGGPLRLSQDQRQKSIELEDQEILIDFKPAPVSPDARAILNRLSTPTRRFLPLQKTLSDGEIRVERRELVGEAGEPSYPHTCRRNHQDPWSRTVRTSVEFSSTPEDLSLLRVPSPQDDHHEEEFHENLIRRGLFRKRSVSLEDGVQGPLSGDFMLPRSLPTSPTSPTSSAPRRMPQSPKDETPLIHGLSHVRRICIPGILSRTSPVTGIIGTSPFASSDSLANDITRDHSDGIWNESQATVLQADSLALLTPKKRLLLLLQHQQDSSMDTEALDAEDVKEMHTPSPRIRLEPATPVQPLTPSADTSTMTTSNGRARTGFRRSSPAPSSSQPQSQSSSEFCLSLARTDSGGRTNTDLSETSTTEDYFTANTSTETGTTTGTSATTSSWSRPPQTSSAAASASAPASTTATAAEGSSFESASSIYSLARSEAVVEEPCSPRPIEEETENLFGVEELLSPARSTSSSSSGSYDLKDAMATMQELDQIALESGHVSEAELEKDEGHRSSSGGYAESPPDQRAWNEEERRRKRKTLDLTNGMSVTESEHIIESSCSHYYRMHHHHHYHMHRDTGDSGRHRRTRESPRRKNGGYVPTRRRSNEDKNAAITGSLPRRRSRIADDVCSNRLNFGRYQRSPGHEYRAVIIDRHSPEARLKALSAESLRSVSPGSDSVFYSEGTDQPYMTVATLDEPHCHHCGRKIYFEVSEEIVKPPADFADSPEGHRSTSSKHGSSQRLYKKFDKSYRLEDRSDRRYRRSSAGRSDIRAKSEERAGPRSGSRGSIDETAAAGRKRLQVRSTDASMEILTGREDEDDYVEPYTGCEWIYIGDFEESHVWRRPDSRGSDDDILGSLLLKERRGSQESTESERNFRHKYQAATHRMVHRKSSGEMYRRIQTKNFADSAVRIGRLLWSATKDAIANKMR